ncbi:cytidylate kinase [Gigaspora margarita]|uniref:(d)CMP kinase n=1 Tax=Gigaspora margarita TaxID=4874 RepID=A0A8H3X4W0_GIGMA|nr:cytidylate kinase [Gigaspora margarita]
MNITIDGLCVVGKSVVGRRLAKQLGYIFIDSGLLYRYFSLTYFYLTNEQIQTKLITQKKEIIKNPLFYLKEFNIVYNLDKSTYILNRKRAAQLAKNNEIRKVINEIIKAFTSSKGFVVAGRDASINIIPDADIKIVLTADLTTHVARRYLENYDDYGKNIPYFDIKKDFLLHDLHSYKFIEDATKVLTLVINTTRMTIDQVSLLDQLEFYLCKLSVKSERASNRILFGHSFSFHNTNSHSANSATSLMGVGYPWYS